MVIDGEKLRIESNKLKGIREWPRKLTSLKQLRTTLGILGYQRPFIPGFAQITYPLTRLLKKGVKFIWTDKCTAAVDTLINIVTSDPILWQPNPAKPYKLEVDASQEATGAILW